MSDELKQSDFDACIALTQGRIDDARRQCEDESDLAKEITRLATLYLISLRDAMIELKRIRATDSGTTNDATARSIAAQIEHGGCGRND